MDRSNLWINVFWKNRRVFITGHTGFKGSWLCLWLQSMGAQVTGYALSPPTDPSLFGLAKVGDLVKSAAGDVRDGAALAGLSDVAETVLADIEQGPWPLEGRRFDAVLVTHYLWRPLWPRILSAVAPGGRWIHETFGREHAQVGRPSNPDFLLEPGELLQVAAAAGWRVRAYEDGWLEDPRRQVQRIVAQAGASSAPPSWPL